MINEEQIISRQIITQGHINKLYEMYEALEKFQWIMSDNIKTVQDQHGNDIVVFEREQPVVGEDGKLVKDEKGGNLFAMQSVSVQQKQLWLEIKRYGRECYDIYKTPDIMKGLYPEIWNMFKQEEQLIKDLREYELKIFGFDHQKMTLPKYIELTQQLIEVALTKKINQGKVCMCGEFGVHNCKGGVMAKQ